MAKISLYGLTILYRAYFILMVDTSWSHNRTMNTDQVTETEQPIFANIECPYLIGTIQQVANALCIHKQKFLITKCVIFVIFLLKDL